MLKKRLIPSLLLQNGRMVKGEKFSNYRDVGDPVSAAKIYNSQYVDELVFIDIDATKKDQKTNCDIIKKVSEVCHMPLTIGGGIKSISDISALLNSGADKVLINSELYNSPNLLKLAVKKFGSSCIVAGIDVKVTNDTYELYKNLGSEKVAKNILDHIEFLESEGTGELYINNISNDGLMKGYNLDLIRFVLKHTSIPVIACGGAGNFAHVLEAFTQTEIGALAMSSIFHFGDNNPIRLRSYLKNNKIPIKRI